MNELEIIRAETADHVVVRVVEELVEFISAKHAVNSEVHISLTGGRAGTAICAALFSPDNLAQVKPALLHIWWSDERYLESGNAERNDSALPDSVADSGVHHHAISGPDRTSTPQISAQKYGQELHLALTTRFCASNTLMDICLLSIGPDGHVASLFPHSEQLDVTLGTIAVLDSPKPPPIRVTWTYPTINSSDQVWLIATGAEKADRVKEVIDSVDPHQVPAAGVYGKSHTKLFVDSPAAEKI